MKRWCRDGEQDSELIIGLSLERYIALACPCSVCPIRKGHSGACALCVYVERWVYIPSEEDGSEGGSYGSGKLGSSLLVVSESSR